MCASADTGLREQVLPYALFYENRIKTPFSVNNEINGFFRFSALCEFVIMFKW
ncbi:hypothetical protein KHRBS_18080 [Bacillus subtilis subsp. subtilis]|nr:hypothetical protein KHRBS_18080 [Bacillus subtilis subsp. subtilis]